MGTEYMVACRDCKVTRDLDKFYALAEKVSSREEAVALGTEMQKPGWAFRGALLASFLWTHKGHNCTVFSEHDHDLSEELDPYYEMSKADVNYWSSEKTTLESE